MKIAIISGSARPKRQSHQVALAIQERLASLKYDLWLWDVKETSLPLLDYTYETHPEPGAVLRDLKVKLDNTDAFIIVSPEHNSSYSGSLKNSMDYFFSEYAGKPAGIVSVSSGVLGGINAVKNLQQYALKINAIVYPPFLITPKVQTLFTDGKISDEGYAQRMDGFVSGFLEFIAKFKS